MNTADTADRRSRLRAATILCAGAAACGVALLGPASRALALGPAVAVYPIPGDRVATRETQIVIRGIRTSQFGSITVTGSRSGRHAGVVRADSDGKGGSFLPRTPFRAGETVTVATGLNIDGDGRGSWRFHVQTPAVHVASRPLRLATRAHGDTWSFRTRTDLKPASLAVTHPAGHGTAGGDIFLAPQAGPYNNGAELLNGHGRLVWFHRVPAGQFLTDFREQSYNGKPVLTWWQGTVTSSGTGRGNDVIYNSSYQPVASFHAGNGLRSDLHEFQLTNANTALVTAYEPIIGNASKTKHASRHEVIYDSVAQEVDIKTGLVLWQWDSVDHVDYNDSYSPPAQARNVPWDYFHINSIQLLPDGNFLISSRNTDAIYKVSALSGGILWRLNGRHSSFKMGPGTRFEFQHDARLQFDGSTITLFDDAGAPFREPQSRALTIDLNFSNMSATLARGFTHKPALKAPAEGNNQQLSNGDDLVGWGQAPVAATEFSPTGRILFDLKFVGANSSYRAYRFSWTGTPRGRPVIDSHTYKGQTSVSVSWNGTTTTHRWRILSGARASKLSAVGSYLKQRFESTIQTHRQLTGYVAVQALNAAGRVQATSKAIRVG